MSDVCIAWYQCVYVCDMYVWYVYVCVYEMCVYVECIRDIYACGLVYTCVWCGMSVCMFMYT